MRTTRSLVAEIVDGGERVQVLLVQREAERARRSRVGNRGGIVAQDGAVQASIEGGIDVVRLRTNPL